MDVTGIELAEPMVAQLRTMVDEQAIPVVLGDMAAARADGEYLSSNIVHVSTPRIR